MGCSTLINADAFPKQGEFLSTQVEVYFNYDTTRAILGWVVRDDIEGDGTMIVKLEDGRYVLSTECMFSPI